jgi:hypothetical protein
MSTRPPQWIEGIMSRWAKVIIQESSDYAMDTPGTPEVTGRAFVWEVLLEKFDDFAALRQAVLATVLATQEPRNEQSSDEKELTIHYVMRTQHLSARDPVIKSVGELCTTFASILV